MQNTDIVQKNFMQAPCSKLKQLNHLFFELNDKNIDKKGLLYPNKKIKDGLKIDKIRSSLLQLKEQALREIYLVGGEPLLHPDFNSILRMCLKVTNTTIITNGTLINEKKARFLRKIDDESKFETIFRINMSHWNEQKNDEIRGYGNFRRVMSCINSLVKYEFNPIINFMNNEKITKLEAYNGFKELFNRYGIVFEEINLKYGYSSVYEIIDPVNLSDDSKCEYDCSLSRVISKKGVFACPLLCNDFRARVGADLSDYSKKIYLDTEKCSICRSTKSKIYVNDWI